MIEPFTHQSLQAEEAALDRGQGETTFGFAPLKDFFSWWGVEGKLPRGLQ